MHQLVDHHWRRNWLIMLLLLLLSRALFLFFLIAGNKAKRRISKRGVSRKQSTPNFPKNELFLTPEPCKLIDGILKQCANKIIKKDNLPVDQKSLDVFVETMMVWIYTKKIEIMCVLVTMVSDIY